MNPRYSILAVLSLATLAGMALSSLPGCTTKISDSTVERISITDAAERVKKSGSDILILDARSPTEYAAGHIPGARHISLPDVDELDPDPSLKGRKMIIVYGQNPGSGAAMALSKRLLAAEVGTVRLMEDGFARWADSGQPIATAP